MKARTLILGLAFAVAMAMTGCGTMSPGLASRGVSSGVISQTDAYAIKSLNSNLDLDTLDFEEAGLPFDDLTADYSSLGLTDLFKNSNKVGFIRSVSDGTFYLATTTGLVFKKDLDMPLQSASESKALTLAKYLNKKVMVRGPIKGGTLTVERVMAVPDLSVITDVLSKGRVAGEICEDSTKTALKDASVKLVSISNGKIYRATSDKKGKYHFSRLEAGAYQLEASKVGYNKVQMQVTVTKRKKIEQNLSMMEIGE